jgi:ribonuclease HII
MPARRITKRCKDANTVPKPFLAEKAHDYPAVIGCDEVGRGALCGPVVCAAVWFQPTAIPLDLLCALDDSKKIKPALREALATEIAAHCKVAVAGASANVIDTIGIRHATLDAMRRAVLALRIDAPVLIDGRDIPPGIDLDCTAVVRGDSIVPQIAAGSIVAKVTRDRIMRLLARRHPHYRWETNSGYGTADHLEALQLAGCTDHHRKSFAPVTSLLLPFEEALAPQAMSDEMAAA